MPNPTWQAPRPEALADAHPEWQDWLALLELARREAADPAWREIVWTQREALDGRPSLAGAVVTLDGRRARGWARVLCGAAARAGGRAASLSRLERIDTSEALELIAAALDADRVRLAAHAERAGADTNALTAIAPLLAAPVLHEAARRGAGAGAAAWSAGYCPVCGAWPALAEARGLERSRQLRCARCGSDWRIDWLACPFCGEHDHRRLGALVNEAAPETCKVETCGTCCGYIKTLTTLRAAAPAEVVLLDLATVELDVAALERDFRRPDATGHWLGVRVEARRLPGLRWPW